MCIDDPCSGSAAILQAQSELEHAWSGIKGAGNFSQKIAAAQVVKGVLAKYQAALAECVAAHGGASANVIAGQDTVSVEAISILGGPGYGAVPLFFQPVFLTLTFDAPFFTTVTLGLQNPPAEIVAEFADPATQLPVAVVVNDLAGSGTYSRCTGNMVLDVTFTTTTKATDGSVTTDSYAATVKTEYAMSPALQEAVKAFKASGGDWNDSAFTKSTGPTPFNGGLTGHVTIQGGLVATTLGPLGALNMTMHMGPAFPRV